MSNSQCLKKGRNVTDARGIDGLPDPGTTNSHEMDQGQDEWNSQ